MAFLNKELTAFYTSELPFDVGGKKGCSIIFKLKKGSHPEVVLPTTLLYFISGS